MTPHQQFTRHAESYDRYNMIQTRVARALADSIRTRPRHLVDLGCGSGGFFRAWGRPFTSYLAIDLSSRMLARHPDAPGVKKQVGDFNDPALFEDLARRDFDLLVSSSALQWSKDLDATLAGIAALGKPVALTIFTDGTFRSLRQVTGSPSPIRSWEESVASLRRHLDVRIDRLSYRLYFDDTLAMLRYIKRSGVSGGRKMLTLKETRRLLEAYTLPYLEFEVIRALSPRLTGTI